MPSDSIVSELTVTIGSGGAQHTPKQPSPTFWAHGPLVGDRCSKGPWMFLFLSFSIGFTGLSVSDKDALLGTIC